MRMLWVILMLCAVASSVCAGGASAKYAIRCGKIVTMESSGPDPADVEVINHGVVLVSQGKIEAMGPAADINVPDGYRQIDASDRWVMPGIVEAHSHIGTEGGWNDMVVPLNPELRITDCVDPEDFNVRQAVTGGVTTVHTMPGSGTNLAGFTVVIKLHGSTPEQMILKEIGAMKVSNAFNPERRGGDLGLTRMGMSWMLRRILAAAKTYAESWQRFERGHTAEKPDYRPEWEKMRKALNGEVPVIVHTCRAWGVMQAMRAFSDAHGLTVIPTHTPWGGYLVGHEARRRDNVHINIGPRLLSTEYADRFDQGVRGMGSEYARRGVGNLSINTDAPVLPQEELSYQAAMSARFGLDEVLAMKAITINSARALGIDDRVGSLRVGKDADLVIKRGSLLEVTTPVDLVLINGEVAYRRPGINLMETHGSESVL